jgi:hypothetical protein
MKHNLEIGNLIVAKNKNRKFDIFIFYVSNLNFVKINKGDCLRLFAYSLDKGYGGNYVFDVSHLDVDENWDYKIFK